MANFGCWAARLVVAVRRWKPAGWEDGGGQMAVAVPMTGTSTRRLYESIFPHESNSLSKSFLITNQGFHPVIWTNPNFSKNIDNHVICFEILFPSFH